MRESPQRIGASAKKYVAIMEGRVMRNGMSSNRVLDIAGYRVTFMQGDGWQCTCELYKEAKGCRHVAIAAALTTWETAVIAVGGSITRH